ncbi:MAG: right-handed parallel beta-helix repeat-containing protein, partial [Saprospiraceae bacterium]|nr:right-handed parallel beta-helix repeat-containing protein [Saprospiraceae bacterium]
LDGQDIAFIDAVKAEGTDGNWAHHITLEHLTVINHGEGDLIVGINTKCPAWNWQIRYCTFLEPGLGMYLGAPDGTAAFVNGVIEYNLIVHPRRYGIQVKHQFEGSRDVAGMPESGMTTIRYNVISKAENADLDDPRPNLLIGGFPEAGNGSDDWYEIYGNLLWQNPNEGLFQGTGNFAFYNNVLVNHHPAGWGIFSFPHNGQPPRDISILNNTILSQAQGIRLSGQDQEYEQLITGNAIFSDQPVWDLAAGMVTLNVLAPFEEAETYVQAADDDLALIDLTPTKAMQGAQLMFDTAPLTEAHLDFDYHERDWTFRGAYSRIGPPAWQPALEIRPPSDSLATFVVSQFDATSLEIFPNPVRPGGQLWVRAPEGQEGCLGLFHMNGQHLDHFAGVVGTTTITVPMVDVGVYPLVWTDQRRYHAAVLIIQH